ncbi:Ferric/cupric reductase transmembrane component 7 [Trichoderma lentiforme]|uniref:ferric-chelate reductase (NADPH) n=1 Tax=Trichoderma lentiforme TaxID=1567552 RepID=A0A9P4XHD2_9HYPO|nr:Ferric/cupric reductase transmembrane component 7 [Trichoderma lentiforme]
MSAAWLTPPVTLTGSREFTCDSFGFTQEQCDYYQQRWHFWFIADHVYALSTIAFLMSVLGIFVIGNIVSQLLGHRTWRGSSPWQKVIAVTRYLSYRGFHVQALRWNSAPLGLLLIATAGTVFFFCMDLIPQPYYWPSLDFGGSPPLGTRSGWMALACMPFVFATATKTNWITLLTGVSHEKLQVFHRWISYAFFLLALMHTFPFIVFHIRFGDMVMQFEMGLIFYWTGIVAIILQAWLTFASHSVIRNLGYEFFKATHLLAAAVFVLIFFWHCDYTLTSWHYFIATAAVYVPCYIYPWLRTCFEYGTRSKAQVTVEDGGFTRISIPANFTWIPGQHCFLRFTGFGFFQSISAHPFTICSMPGNVTEGKSELIFYIRHQRGLTARLYQSALKSPGASIPVLVDGPYGGINLQSYAHSDHLLVIAGGSGAGWTLPFIEQFVMCQSKTVDEERGQAADLDGITRKMESNGRKIHGPFTLRVIVAIRDATTRLWYMRTVKKLLSRYETLESVSSIRIQLHLTGEAAQEVDLADKSLDLPADLSKSASLPENIISQDGRTETMASALFDEQLDGRPQLPLIIQEEAARAANGGESLAVFVCGPVTMQDDVRNAVAEANLNILKGSRSGGVYLHSEHFSWA